MESCNLRSSKLAYTVPGTDQDFEIPEARPLVNGFSEARELFAEPLGPHGQVVLWRQVEIEPEMSEIE